MALQQRADEAQKDELMRAVVVWGLPREARWQDRMPWDKAEVEKTVRSMLAEQHGLLGVDLAATPPRILFRTSAPRTRFYDKYVTTRKRTPRQDRRRGKGQKWQSHDAGRSEDFGLPSSRPGRTKTRRPSSGPSRTSRAKWSFGTR